MPKLCKMSDRLLLSDPSSGEEEYNYEEETTSSEDNLNSEITVNRGKRNNRHTRTNFHGSRNSRPKSNTKNAILARQNRIRKKMYVTNLENDVDLLREDNRRLKYNLKKQLGLSQALKKEVTYLKSVIANGTDIKELLRSINIGLKNGGGVNIKRERGGNSSTAVNPLTLTSPQLINDPLITGFNADNTDPIPPFHDIFQFNLPEERGGETGILPDAGICLNIANNQVSLECCQTCNTTFTSINLI